MARVRAFRATPWATPALIVEGTAPVDEPVPFLDVETDDQWKLPEAPEEVTAGHLRRLDEWLADHGYARDGDWQPNEPEGRVAQLEDPGA
jgi:hypothetical protein